VFIKVIDHHWQNSPFLEDSARLHQVFTSSDFATIFVYSKFVSPASNPKPGGPGQKNNLYQLNLLHLMGITTHPCVTAQDVSYKDSNFFLWGT
jgi:hypothetical protein